MSLDRVRDLCREAARHHAAGDYGPAGEIAAEALMLCREALGEKHYAWPLTLCAAAACHVRSDPARANSQLELATEAARRLEVQDFEHAGAALTHAAELYRELGDGATAAGLWHELIQWTGRALGEDHPRYFAAVARLAAALGDAQTPSKART